METVGKEDMKRNEESVTTELIIDGFSGGINNIINAEITKQGYVSKRKGYNTFGEMVHVLWEINKRAKKMGFKGEYTVSLPLRGTKPIYKKTIK